MNPSSMPLSTRRAELLENLRTAEPFDLLVVGGGATGVSVALDAAVRGHRVALLDSHDFAEGTSSRATKLLHGGVRYLAQGNIHLVREALHERTALLHNAPHLAQPLPFVMPAYRFWERPFYGTGLRLYDALAGAASIADTVGLDRGQTLQALPTLRTAGLRGGVRFWDGQFDDARLAIAIARTAAEHGALLVNHLEVNTLLHEAGKVSGVRCRDTLSGAAFDLKAACVVNATGVWVDHLRALDARTGGRAVQTLVAPSQGVHLVFDRDLLPGDHALLVPRTRDGRVLFAVPWLGRVVLGTTDTPRQELPIEPRPLQEEIDFLLDEAAQVLTRAPQRQDVRSAWVGLRPLVSPHGAGEASGPTRRISREHTVLCSPSGLVSVTGGKWTTCRAMAESVLAACEDQGLLERRPAGATATLRLVGGRQDVPRVPISAPPGLHLYGDEAEQVNALPGADRWLAPGLSEAMLRFAVRHEYACTVSDVLARRSRLLFLDARQAADIAPSAARIVAEETGSDPCMEDFIALTQSYLRLP